MPGETTGGPTERPPRPRRERPVTRETVRPIDTRENVEAAFYDSFGLLEHTDNSKLSPELQWAKKAIRSSIDKSLDRDSDTVTVDYNGEYTKFRQEEGIPVDHLIDFLNDKLSDSRYDTAERKNLQEKINILKRNSTPFYDVDLARSNPEQMVARIRYEAHLISQDSRATGSELGDWELAKKELNKRRELFVTPPSEPTAETEAGTVPADVTPPTATEPEPEFIGPPPPPAWAREILTVIGRRDEEIRNNALLERYQKIREEMKRGSLWDPRTWTRKIGLRLGEDYFGAKYLTKAIRAKLESGSTKAQAAFEGSAVDADYKRAEEQEAGKLGIKRARETKLFEGEKVTDATGELKKKIVDGLLKPIVDGTITDEKQLQAKIKEFVQSNQDNAELKAIFGPEASKYGNWADYFASDLLEMGASVRETMATHSKTLEELDSYIKIKLANLSWTAETGAPKVGAIDKLVMKMQGGSKRGLIWNPATLGATASLGTAVGLRALGTTAQASQFIVPGVGAVVGGGVAGLRRYHDMNVDRTAAQIEDTYSQSSEGNAPRRESLSQRDYDRAHVGELINGSGTDLVTGEERESISSLLSKDLSEGQETNRQAVLRRVAEIEKRLGFSRKEGLDLIRYDSQDTVQHGRLALLEAAISARNKLKEAGMSDEQIRETETRLKGEWEEKFIQNRDEQDRAFASYRLRNAAGSALFGGLAGLGAGALVQEGVAVTGRALGVNVGETGLEWAGKRIAEVGRAGRAAASELPETNTAAASTLIQEIQGGSKPSSTVNEVVQTMVANKEVPVAEEWAKNATNIDERIWDKGNDQLLHTIKKGNALGLDITRMGENVQKLVRGGEIGFAFTTNNGQTVFISESSDMVKDGVLWLDPNSKNAKVAEFAKIILNQNELAKYQDGDIATELYNRKGVFNVKYVEAAQLVSDGNKNILHAHATIQGTGNMPSTVDVPQTIETPKPITETPKPIQTPPGQGTETPRPITTAIPSASPSPTPTPTPGGGFDFGIPKRPGEEIPAPPLIPIPFSPRHPLESVSERRAEPTTEEARPEAPAPTAEPVAEPATPPPPIPTATPVVTADTTAAVAAAPAPEPGLRPETTAEATIPTETPLPKAKDLKFGPEFDAAREREALAAGWKKSPSGTWTSPDGKRTQSFAPFPESTREPEPVAPPAEPAVVEAPVAPPAIEVGSELIQRDGGEKFTVVREDADKVTLEKKREDGTLESRVTLGREDLEEKLKTPGGAWSAPTAPAETETKAMEIKTSEDLKVGDKLITDEGEEFVITKLDKEDFGMKSGKGSEMTGSREGLDSHLRDGRLKPAEPLTGPAAPKEPATTEAVTPVIEPGMKIRSPLGREYEVIAADERDIVLRGVDGKEQAIDRREVELALAQNEAAIIPAREEEEETPPGTPIFDDRGKIIGFEKPRENVELPPTHPAAEEPLETTEPDSIEELELRKELTKLLHGQADPNMPIAQVKERLAQLKPTAPGESPSVDKEEEEKPIELEEILDEAPAATQGFIPSGNFLADVEKIRGMSEQELTTEGKRRHGEDWQPTKFNQIDLQFELELEANARRTDLPIPPAPEGPKPKIKSTSPRFKFPSLKKIKSEKSAETEPVKIEVTTETAEDKARKYHLAIEERKQKLAEEDEKKKKKTKPMKTEKDEAMRRANIEIDKINETIEGEKRGKRNGNGRPKILENSQMRGKRFHDIKTAIKRNIDKRRKKK